MSLPLPLGLVLAHARLRDVFARPGRRPGRRLGRRRQDADAGVAAGVLGLALVVLPLAAERVLVARFLFRVVPAVPDALGFVPRAARALAAVPGVDLAAGDVRAAGRERPLAHVRGDARHLDAVV